VPVRTESITKAAGPGLLHRTRRRPDAPVARAAGAALAGFLVGSAGAGPVGWWTTVAALSLLALCTLEASPVSATLAGSLAGSAAVGAWLATTATGSTVPVTVMAVAIGAGVGAAYGVVARMAQNWPAWPLALPAVWLGIEALIRCRAAARVDPAAIAQIPGEQASSVVALAAGPVALLLGLASCSLAAAVAGMRRWARARTVHGSLAAAAASLAILVVVESAVHAHDIQPGSPMSAHGTDHAEPDVGGADA
jgi:hypothetical protein